MEKIKLKVGEVFTYKDKTYQVVEVETDALLSLVVVVRLF